jgi:hypothetical protein
MSDQGDSMDIIDVSQIDSVQVVNLQPGDIVVLRYPGVLTKEALVNMRQSLARKDFDILVLEEGMSIEHVIRQEAGCKPSSQA